MTVYKDAHITTTSLITKISPSPVVHVDSDASFHQSLTVSPASPSLAPTVIAVNHALASGAGRRSDDVAPHYIR